MNLSAFINYADPTKDVGAHFVNEGGADGQENPIDSDIVRIEDKVPAAVAEKAKGSRKKRKTARGAIGFGLPPKKLRAYHGTSGAGASTGGKSIAALQGVLERNTFPVDVGVTTVDTLPIITSSVSLTSEREGGGHTDSVTGPNMHPSKRFVVLSDSLCHSSSNFADAEVSSVVRSLVPDPPVITTTVATTVMAGTSVLVPRANNEPVHHTLFPDSASMDEANPDVAGPSYLAGTELSMNSFYVSQDVDLKTLHQAYIPKWNVTKDSAFDDPNVCHNMIDHLAPPVLLSQLCSMDYEQLFVELNVRSARQTCLSSKVRLRLKHELRGRKKFKGKCAMQAGLLKEKDVEIASLKSQLSLEEAEAVEAIHLRSQVATFEAVEAARVGELNSLKERNSALEEEKSVLENKVAALESMDAAKVSLLEGTCYGLHDEVSGGSIGHAIDKGMQDRLVAGIDHGKAKRGLADVAAYDPSTEANCNSTVNALRVVDFPLLALLESQKDASIADIMGLLHLDGDAASQRLSISDAMIPLIEPLTVENLVGEASTTGVLLVVAATTALSTTFVQASSVLPIPLSDYKAMDTEPQAEASSSPKIIFEQETLAENPAT
nr:hypothetical protein [Tanacetum cinerariifolium]